MPVANPSATSAADTAAGPATVAPETGAVRAHPLPAARPRAGAVWVGFGIGMLVLVALVVFMAQNTAPVDVTFLGLHGTARLSLMLAITAVGVAIVALGVGALWAGRLGRPARAWPTAQAHERSGDR
jgi:uncharacterized integral membrane protein